jgi:hypothetical protein
MRIFNLNNQYSVVCEFQGTRYGFRHLATLHRNGFEIAKAKICYYNRTWECYEFESVLLKIIEDNFMDAEYQNFRDIVKNFR